MFLHAFDVLHVLGHAKVGLVVGLHNQSSLLQLHNHFNNNKDNPEMHLSEQSVKEHNPYFF